jgi:hypothetical protein
MSTLFGLIAVLSLIMGFLGLIKPSLALFWAKENQHRKKVMWVYGAVFLISIFMSSLSQSPEEKKAMEENARKAEQEAQVEKRASIPKVGETLKTPYFEITVHEVGISRELNTGNPFSNPKPQQGTQFLFFSVTIKCIDKESRMIHSEGEVVLQTAEGEEYIYDKAETILAEGWGINLLQINPMTSHQTKLAFRIPENIQGTLIWKPSRTYNDELILLGNISE